VVLPGAPSAAALLVCAGISLAACGSKGDAQVSQPPRAEPARPVAAAVVPPEICDLYAQEDQATAFEWPELAAGPAPAAASTWRWVNVWATWCEPCVAEMPKLTAWRDQRAAAGQPIQLAFVSIDDADADVDAFRAAHPGSPPSVRIAGADQRVAWLQRYGLSDGAIPIHLFVSPTNRLRCAHAGEIRDKDFAAIERMIAP